MHVFYSSKNLKHPNMYFDFRKRFVLIHDKFAQIVVYTFIHKKIIPLKKKMLDFDTVEMALWFQQWLHLLQSSKFNP